MVLLMLKSVHAVGVVVQTRQDYRAAGTATGRSTVSMSEPDAFRGKLVQVGGLNGRVTVTPQGLPAVVVGNNQHHIGPGRRFNLGNGPEGEAKQNQTNAVYGSHFKGKVIGGALPGRDKPEGLSLQ